MKKMFLLLATLLAVFGCGTTQVTFTINGTVPESKDGTVVVLTDFVNPSQNDTVYTQNEKFTLTKNIEKPMAMWANDHVFVAESGTINITLGKTPHLGGTTLNDKLHQYNLAYGKLSNELNELVQKLNAIDVSDNPARNDSVLKVINDYYNFVHVPKTKEINTKTFQENRTNPIGAIVFSELIYQDTIPIMVQLEEYFAEYPDAKNNPTLNKTYIILHNELNTAVGKHFTDFTVRNIEDTQDVKLSDYVGRGDYILVDFWASWCGPCIAAIPNLKIMQQKYGRKNFTVVGVNVWDTHAKAVASIKEKDLKWPQLYDNSGRGKGCSQIYGVQGIPTLILFSPSGEIILRTHNSQEVLDLLEKTIK